MSTTTQQRQARIYAAQRRREKRDAAKTAKTLLPSLETNRDWALATSPPTFDDEWDHGRFLRAIVHMTKKAVTLMYPDHPCTVQRGRGTGYSWVLVHVHISREAMQHHFERTGQQANLQLKDVLEALGIQYSDHSSDQPGTDRRDRDLSVSMDDIRR